MPAERRRVVVTGTGAVTPLGVGAEPLYTRWAGGECAIENRAGRATAFVPQEHLSVKEVRRLDRNAQFAVVASDEAIAQAGWDDGAPYDPYRVGCIVATGIGGIQTVERGHDTMRDRGPDRIPPLSIPMYMPNAAAAAVSMRHGLRGQMYGIVSACAAGANAIGAAVRMIQYGDADAVLAGGTEAAVTEFGFACFDAMQTLSPEGHSRPFDARRDGFVLGEGAGMLVLEEAQAAAARGARILGEVIGYGSTADAHHLTAPDPTGEPAARAITLALRDAGVQPGDVSYVNAHGTSTQLNDAAETAAIKRAFGEHAYTVPISSTKSAIGHLLGAAGAVEAVATLLTLGAGVAAPTLGLEVPDPELDLDYVPGVARPLRAAGDGSAVAVSNSFAFGGHNTSLVLRGAVRGQG